MHVIEVSVHVCVYATHTCADNTAHPCNIYKLWLRQTLAILSLPLSLSCCSVWRLLCVPVLMPYLLSACVSTRQLSISCTLFTFIIVCKRTLLQCTPVVTLGQPCMKPVCTLLTLSSICQYCVSTVSTLYYHYLYPVLTLS